MNVLVEGFNSDARALAQFLAGEGHAVRIASPGKETAAVKALGGYGITVEPLSNLDRDPGPADVAYLDVWTPEIAPRVQRLRAQGTRISSLGDLLLNRWPGPTVGITGTAGKTTTTSLVASILRAGGTDVAVSAGARAGNLWPTGELLDLLVEMEKTERVLLLELTSSHLAFIQSSPTIAAIISFWPDHLELHGDHERYRAAKATIAQHQDVDDTLVLNADDAAAGFASDTCGHIVEFSQLRPVRCGAYRRSDSALALVGRAGDEIVVHVPLGTAVHPGNVLAAAAIAAAAGAQALDVTTGIASASPLPYRARPIGTIGGVPVVDDGMAATPAKTRAFLAGYADRTVVLIAGGTDDAGGGRVHATPEESVLLEIACDEIARVARSVVVFGVAGTRLAALLVERGVDVRATDTLAVAVALAAQRADSAAAIVFSPLFPVALGERSGFKDLVASLG